MLKTIQALAFIGIALFSVATVASIDIILFRGYGLSNIACELQVIADGGFMTKRAGECY